LLLASDADNVYSLTLEQAVTVGDSTLPPGKYKVAVMEGSRVRFTDASGQSVEATADVRVSNGKNFRATVVETR
jgi:hypothetical protein